MGDSVKCDQCGQETDEEIVCHHCGNWYGDGEFDLHIIRRLRKLEGKDNASEK